MKKVVICNTEYTEKELNLILNGLLDHEPNKLLGTHNLFFLTDLVNEAKHTDKYYIIGAKLIEGALNQKYLFVQTLTEGFIINPQNIIPKLFPFNTLSVDDKKTDKKINNIHAPQAIRIGKKTYTSKNQAIMEINRRLQKYPENMALNGEDFVFIRDIFGEKTNTIKNIEVEISRTGERRLFATDDTGDRFQFSYRHIIGKA